MPATGTSFVSIRRGYADSALWQAAATAQEAYRRFGDDRDRQTTVRMLQWLSAEYPHSPFAARAAGSLAGVSPSSPTTDTPLRAIERTSLPEVVRVTVELEREVAFYQERLSDPERLFFDLKGTRPVDALRDAVLRFDDDVVREIRLGRHPNNTTRVVLDLQGVRRYSVFTLYNPYRIVIDCERAVEASTISSRRAPGASDPGLPNQGRKQPASQPARWTDGQHPRRVLRRSTARVGRLHDRYRSGAWRTRSRRDGVRCVRGPTSSWTSLSVWKSCSSVSAVSAWF